jgi:predicted transcriptional regulator
MLTANLINNNIPRLQPQDTVSKALQLISDFKVTHLPVVSENKFLEHHLGHVITIVRNAVANSDAFENIAQQLQNKRLEEVVFLISPKNNVT